VHQVAVGAMQLDGFDAQAHCAPRRRRRGRPARPRAKRAAGTGRAWALQSGRCDCNAAGEAVRARGQYRSSRAAAARPGAAPARRTGMAAGRAFSYAGVISRRTR
jgi:hypothetical protein